MRVVQQKRSTTRTPLMKRAAPWRNLPGRCKPEPRVELLLDSFGAASCGARATTHPQRHLLYRAAPYELDLLLELNRETNRLMVTGQLLDTSLPMLFRRGIKVTLWNFRRSFVTLRTNEWGEFLGEIEDSGELMVSLKIKLREIVISTRNVLDWPASES